MCLCKCVCRYLEETFGRQYATVNVASRPSTTPNYSSNVSLDDLEYPTAVTGPGGVDGTTNKRGGGKHRMVNYYDDSIVMPMSVEFEHELHYHICLSEGDDAVSEYLLANPTHISLKQPLIKEIPHSTLGYVCFYTLEIIDEQGGDAHTVTTGLSGASYSATYGCIKAYCVPNSTYAGEAAGFVDILMER